MTVVNGTLTSTGGAGLPNWQVRGVLYAASNVTTIHTEITEPVVDDTDAAGVWSLDLVPNSLLVQPAGSYYSIEVREPPSGDWDRIATCYVPPSGPVNLDTILAVPAPQRFLVVPYNSPTFTGTLTQTGRTVRQYTNLVDAATVAVDASLGDHFRLLMTAAVGNTRQLGNPTNPPNAGQDQMLLIAVTQDGAGSRLLTFGSKYRFGTDISSITLTATAGKTDYIGVRYNSVDDKWDVIAFVKGY